MTYATPPPTPPPAPCVAVVVRADPHRGDVTLAVPSSPACTPRPFWTASYTGPRNGPQRLFDASKPKTLGAGQTATLHVDVPADQCGGVQAADASTVAPPAVLPYGNMPGYIFGSAAWWSDACSTPVPTPTLTPTPTPTPTEASPSPTPTLTPTATPTPTPTAATSPTPTPTLTASPTSSPTTQATPVPTASPITTASAAPSASPSTAGSTPPAQQPPATSPTPPTPAASRPTSAATASPAPHPTTGTSASPTPSAPTVARHGGSGGGTRSQGGSTPPATGSPRMQGEYGTLAHTGPLALIPLALAGLGLIYVRRPLRRWASRHPRRTT